MADRHGLLRFLNKTSGPVVRLQSSCFESESSGKYWYSVADLSAEITGDFRKNDILRFAGGGWSTDRQVSQEKAIVEALERWAFRYYLDNNPHEAGLDVDATSNGFAALPRSFGLTGVFRHSLCEAIERFLLNHFWIERKLKLEELSMERLVPQLEGLFERHNGSASIYGLRLEVPAVTAQQIKVSELYFVLSLFWRSNLGVTPGSACGIDLESTAERACLEALNHLNALSAYEAGRLKPSDTITDKRLIYFGTDVQAREEVHAAVSDCLERGNERPFPNIRLLKELPGPWLPEILVSRAVVADSPPIILGDEKRFLI